MTGLARLAARRRLTSAVRRRLSPTALKRLALRARLQARGCYDRKVFCVGRNKTGTTTLETFLTENSFRVAPQAAAERLHHENGHETTAEFWNWADRWEAFQDAPFSQTRCLPELVERHPDARFILTVRDPEEWYASLLNHHAQIFELPPDASRAELAERLRAADIVAPGYLHRAARLQYGIDRDEDLYDKDLYIENFRRHQARVKDLVPADNLLEIDLSEHPTTAALCRFLGMPRSLVGPTPRSNRRR